MQQDRENMLQQQQQQQARYNALADAHALLQKQQADRSAIRESKQVPIALPPEVQGCVPPHLQLESLEAPQRKQVITSYVQHDLPKHIRDENGLASRAITSSENRKWVVTHLPQLQRDALDVLRISTAAWVQATNMPNGPQRDMFLFQALQDITLISVDNAQRIAKLQLKQTFEGSNAKNAQSIMDFKPDSDNVSINPKDNNILQQAHIEAIQELQRFNKSIDAAKPK